MVGVGLFKVVILAEPGDQVKMLSAELRNKDLVSCLMSNSEMESVAEKTPDLILVDTNGSKASLQRRSLAQQIKQELELPVVALVDQESLGSLDNFWDDFVVKPCQSGEVVARIKRILLQGRDIENNNEAIRCGDLEIDLAKCEVTLCGKIIDLAFREYELLKFLVANKDRVFTREALLNKVWGYDYYGGERTVDVHIRRLRSKIEDAQHTFIDTVRNIGYRFKS